MNIIQFLYSIPIECSLVYQTSDCAYIGCKGPERIGKQVDYWVSQYTPMRVLEVIIGGIPCCGAGLDAQGLPVCKTRCKHVFAKRPMLDGKSIMKDYIPVCPEHRNLGAALGYEVQTGCRGGLPTEFGSLLEWV